MKTTIGQRLSHILKSKELTQQEFALMLNKKSRAGISVWVTGDQDIPNDIIVSIIKLFPDINADWFINDRGKMLANDTSEEPALPYNVECKNPICKMKIEHLEKTIGLLENNLEDLRRKEHCGSGEIEGSVETPCKTG